MLVNFTSCMDILILEQTDLIAHLTVPSSVSVSLQRPVTEIGIVSYFDQEICLCFIKFDKGYARKIAKLVFITVITL